MNTKHGAIFRCQICGKFISYDELDKNKIHVEYTPETDYTNEEITFTHKQCIKNKSNPNSN